MRSASLDCPQRSRLNDEAALRLAVGIFADDWRSPFANRDREIRNSWLHRLKMIDFSIQQVNRRNEIESIIV